MPAVFHNILRWRGGCFLETNNGSRHCVCTSVTRLKYCREKYSVTEIVCEDIAKGCRLYERRLVGTAVSLENVLSLCFFFSLETFDTVNELGLQCFRHLVSKHKLSRVQTLYCYVFICHLSVTVKQECENQLGNS